MWGRNYILKWVFFSFSQFWPIDIFIVESKDGFIINPIKCGISNKRAAFGYHFIQGAIELNKFLNIRLISVISFKLFVMFAQTFANFEQKLLKFLTIMLLVSPLKIKEDYWSLGADFYNNLCSFLKIQLFVNENLHKIWLLRSLCPKLTKMKTQQLLTKFCKFIWILILIPLLKIVFRNKNRFFVNLNQYLIDTPSARKWISLFWNNFNFFFHILLWCCQLLRSRFHKNTSHKSKVLFVS